MSAPARGGLFSQLPTMFSTYELLELFPGGGMSWVYKARTKIGKTVVVKILRQEESDPETVQRFVDEARTAASLNHPNIVSVYDFGEIDGKLFMVMEYLDGQDLLKHINEKSITDLKDKLRIAAEAASALRHVHQHGILHRDIKPGNIYVCSTGNVKLIDFGIAKSAINTAKTRAGFTVGTLHYMAPEQVRGEADPRTDIYAFGLVLFQLLTGEAPVRGETVEAIFYCILNEPLNLAPMEALHAPRSLIDLVCQCTQKDPALRPANFDEVCHRLEEIRTAMTPQPSVVLPPPPPVEIRKPARRPWPTLAAAALVPVVALGAWWLLRPGAPSPQPVAPPPAKAKTGPPAVLDTAFGSMLLVPAGAFRFGKDGGSAQLPDFYIDRTEVTIDAWRRYCAEHGCPAVQGQGTLPVSDVTFEAARTFCETVGKRLPNAHEWEKAARGPSGFSYPWGEQPTASNANVENESGPTTVGAFPAGASPVGALDMAGNVWEFVSDSRAPAPQEIDVFRKLGLKPPPTATEPWVLIYGGSYAGPLSQLWDAALVPARYSHRSIGLRCAANP